MILVREEGKTLVPVDLGVVWASHEIHPSSRLVRSCILFCRGCLRRAWMLFLLVMLLLRLSCYDGSSRNRMSGDKRHPVTINQVESVRVG
jgi:hypothetical protein